MTAAATNRFPEVPAQPSRQLPAEGLLHSTTSAEIDLRLLSLLEQNPAWTQRQIADALGVSLGKINYCLRALRDKGLVKWGNYSQNSNKLQYMHLLTPQGYRPKAAAEHPLFAAQGARVRGAAVRDRAPARRA